MKYYVEFNTYEGKWEPCKEGAGFPGGTFDTIAAAQACILRRSELSGSLVKHYRIVAAHGNVIKEAPQVTNDAPGFPGVTGPEQGIPAKDVAAMGDMKAALRGGVKPDLTHVRTPLLNYIARACEYGNDKYERSNYLRATKGNKEDFERLRAYLRAAVSHTLQTLDAMEAHQATDPKLEDVKGMKKAAFAVDTDPDKTGKVGPSMLPHLCGAAASFMMAITQATNAGLLPADPGTPWRK